MQLSSDGVHVQVYLHILLRIKELNMALQPILLRQTGTLSF